MGPCSQICHRGTAVGTGTEVPVPENGLKCRIDSVRKESYLLWRTYVRNLRRRRFAHRTAAGDLGLPGRLRRSARLPADGAGDRGRGWARVAFDGSRSPGQPRAGRVAETGPDEAARPRALGTRASGVADARRASTRIAPGRRDRGGRAAAR